jgi:outer membrane protein OmpA-like peptidoglycan-associated protein
MTARVTVPAAVALVIASLPAVASAAEDDERSSARSAMAAAPRQSDLSEFILDIDATVLDINATIVDLDGATRTTERPDRVTVTLNASVFFDEEKHELRPDSIARLRQVARQIRADKARSLAIAGHTDHLGTNEYNQGLSERRANAVEDFLAGELAGVSMSARGFGETRPIAPNETASGEDNPEGRALNRRVELTYQR